MNNNQTVGIIVYGMKIPTRCMECDFISNTGYDTNFYCTASSSRTSMLLDDVYIDKIRPRWCPIKEVSREQLIKLLSD